MQTKEHNLAKLGIIAGAGNLPLNIIYNAIATNREFYVVVIDDEITQSYNNYPHVIITVGQVGRIIEALNEQNIKEVVLAGSITKPSLTSLKLDALGTKLIARILKNKFLGDNSILSIVVKFIEEQGFIVKGAEQYLQNNVVSKGVLTIIKPNEQELKNIELGKKISLAIGELDIGQAVIVEDSVVLGVESIEGTKNLIARCSGYKLSPWPCGCLVKMKKPYQEPRVDLPSIGVDTINQLYEAGFKGIAIEANHSIIIDFKEVIRLANELNMFIIAI
jgi:DUF1009 family protein